MGGGILPVAFYKGENIFFIFKRTNKFNTRFWVME